MPARAGTEAPGDKGSAEHLIVMHADGRTERMRLQEYARVYGVPGLYEEVVQRRLRCASPSVVADLLCGAVRSAGSDRGGLRLLDVAAGNGVLGEEMQARGVGYIVGLDNIEAARRAAQRDRPGLYADYHLADIADTDRMRKLVADHRLNVLVCAGAVGHLPADGFQRAWESFPPGSWLSVSFYDAHESTPDPVDDPQSVVVGYVRALVRAGRFEVWRSTRFRHRLAMSGEPIPGSAVVGRAV